MAFPQQRSRMFSWLTDYHYAHRGLHDAARAIPENSILAVNHARAAGFGIEVDLQPAADDHVAVFHDIDLTRMCQRNDPVATLSGAQLSQITLSDTDQTIPLLAHLLDHVNGSAPLLLELKSSPSVATTLTQRVMTALTDYRGPVTLMSFDTDTVKTCLHAQQQTQTPIPIGLLLTAASMLKPSPVMRILSHEVDFIGCDHRGFPSPLITTQRRKKTPILTWTVKTPMTQKYVKDYVDAIIFEGFIPAVTHAR